MKTKHTTPVGIAFGAIIVAISLGSVSAQLLDITINDGSPSAIYGTDPRGIGESGETEAGTVSNASWDFRAMGFDPATKRLTVIGGSNPLTKNDGFGMGDLFIDTNNSFTVPSRPSPSNGYLTYANSLAGYEYAVDITGTSGGSLTYNIVGLTGSSTLVTGFYGQNAISDPASLSASSSDLMIAPGGLSVVTTKTNAQVLADHGINVGTNGGTNYVFSFDFSSIAGSFSNGATFRLTQECGNDLLVGRVTPSMMAIPEPSSALLASLGVVSIAFLRQRRK